MHPRSFGQVAVVCLAMLASACANLPIINRGLCGNSIVESGESCDGFVTDDQLYYCRPPGSESGECRYDCSGDYRCPEGFACGKVDGICRVDGENKTYVRWGSPSSLSASRLLLGDFDGDARDDLVTLGNPNPLWQVLPKITFFDEDAEARDPFEPKIPILSPSVVEFGVGDPDLDPREQLLFATAYGIASVSADGNRVVLAEPYPFQALDTGASYRVVTIHGLSSTAMGDGVLVLYGSEDETYLVAADSETPLATMAKPVESFVGDLLAADVDETTPCSEFLYAFEGESSVYAVSPCDTLGRWRAIDSNPSPLATLGDGHTVQGQLLLGFVNDDGHVDLVLGDETGQVHVSFGLGDGRFAANPNAVEATLGQALPLVFEAGDCADTRTFEGYPLAIGDLDDDGRDDWVLPTGIFLSQSVTLEPGVRIEGCPGNAPFVGRWAIAAVADLNRDGLLDLAAAAASEPDFDLFLGTAAARMNRFGLTTEGPVTHLSSGDFDGDLVTDLAYVTETESLDGETSPSESLFIAFGELSGAPTNVAGLGSFRNVRQLSVANYVATDAISELGVVSQRDGSQGEQLAVFIGNAGQHPIAPLGLSILSLEGQNYFDMPIAAALGHFVDPAVKSVLAVGTACHQEPCVDFEYRLWASAYDSTTGFENPETSLDLPEDFAPIAADGGQIALHAVSGDLDGDELDELVLLSAGANPDTVSLFVYRHADNVFSRTPEKVTLTSPLGHATTFDGRLLFESAPVLVDLDLDGSLDLAMILENTAGKKQLRLAWNDGEGHFTGAASDPVSLEGEEPLGLAGNGQRLIVITAGHAFHVPPLSGDRTARAAIELAGITTGGQAVAVGDLTGDGLLDLAIVNQGTLSLFVEVEQEP